MRFEEELWPVTIAERGRSRREYVLQSKDIAAPRGTLEAARSLPRSRNRTPSGSEFISVAIRSQPGE